MVPTATQVVKVECPLYRADMRVMLNGESQNLRDGITVADLIGDLNLNQRRIAVEVNRAIIERAHYPNLALADGDEVEIVHFVGGG